MNILQTGLQTALFRNVKLLAKSLKTMAGAAGFEPATYGFGGRKTSNNISMLFSNRPTNFQILKAYYQTVFVSRFIHNSQKSAPVDISFPHWNLT